MAAEVLPTIPQASMRSPFFRMAMRNLDTGRTAESDLFSYLLFDGDFLDPLTELGYRDAAAQEDALVAFFED
jgi:hypothetical protein